MIKSIVGKIMNRKSSHPTIIALVEKCIEPAKLPHLETGARFINDASFYTL